MRPCRCGKWSLESDDAVVVNDYQHESFARADGFCGPVLHHDLRDLRVALAAAEAERDRMREALQATIDNLGVLAATLATPMRMFLRFGEEDDPARAAANRTRDEVGKEPPRASSRSARPPAPPSPAPDTAKEGRET